MAKRKTASDDNTAFNMLKIGGVIILIILIGITFIPRFINSSNPTDEISEAQIALDKQAQEDQASKEIENKAIVEKLSRMQERDRMEYYVSHFITNCEKGRYDLAYETLGTEFKNNYFATEIEFENYAKSKFPSMADVSFTNIERNNNVYVLWVTITDAINGTKDSGIEYNFVVEEKDINDIQLAFSVK